jgi:CrcB protein
MTALVWIGVAALGGAGAVARFALDGAVAQRFDGEFPLGTFVVNVSGSLALGLLTGLGVGGSALLLGGTAALGSFTTFSTWMLETERLGEDGEPQLMWLNVALSLVAGFAAATCGWLIGRAL